MKKTNIYYWILTVLFAGFMIFSAIPDMLCIQQAIDFITKLGYPVYFIPFIGVAKLLGSIAILIPGYPRIKEWAYAGLIYDLIAAMYSSMATGETPSNYLPMLIFIALAFASYFLYHKKLKLSAAPNA